MGVLLLLLATGFGCLCLLAYQSDTRLQQRGIVTTATIASFDGPYKSGGKSSTQTFRYLLQYDANRQYFVWPQRYAAGEKLRIVYDRVEPSVIRVLNDGESGLEHPGVDWRLVAAALGFALLGIRALRPGAKPLFSS